MSPSTMHVQRRVLPDGRELLFYDFTAPPAQAPEQAASPAIREGAQSENELRWDARYGEWVIVAPQRQDRTHHPPAEYCPLCPTRPGASPTEIPEATFDVAVFENRFPSLTPHEPAVPSPSDALDAVAPAHGRCEVIVYTPRHEGSLGTLHAHEAEHLVRVWADRYRALSDMEGIGFVFIFENRGEEIGVTLGHPHGQIYAYPFVPPIPARGMAFDQAHYERTARCLHCDLIEEELRAGERVIVENDAFVAFVPFAARWTYEVSVAAKRHCASLLELVDDERRALADLLGRMVRGYDALFDRAMPYVMSIHQAPSSHDVKPGSHLRVDFYPALRAPAKLKYRAGSETAMGVFINDRLPEVSAAGLREVLR